MAVTRRTLAWSWKVFVLASSLLTLTGAFSSLAAYANASSPSATTVGSNAKCPKPILHTTLTGNLIVANCDHVRIIDLTLEYGSTLEVANDSNVLVNNVTGLGNILVSHSEKVRVLNFRAGINVLGSDFVQISGGTLLQSPEGSIRVSSSSHVSIRDNVHYTMRLDNDSQVSITGNDFGPRCCTTDFTSLNMIDVDYVTIAGNSFHSDLDIAGQNIGHVRIAQNQIAFSDLNAISLDSCSAVSIQNNQLQTGGGVFGGVTKLNNCSNVNISGNNMTEPNQCCRVDLDFVVVSQSANLTIQENTLEFARTAIKIISSSCVTIAENNIELNKQGVYLNDTNVVKVFHNNFLNNTLQASDTFATGNHWDNGYPSGGNHWSNYTGMDLDGDGIGDTPYMFNDNQDNYPLMQLFPIQ